MSDKMNPKCPWCGGTMSLEYNPFDPYAENNKDEWVYCCDECIATSPIADTSEEAYEKAVHRPLQKPIEKDELFGTLFLTPCWLEARANRKHDNGWCRMFADVLDCDSVGYFAKIHSNRRNGETHYYNRDEYNITWRCWATMPTDEERTAANWED